MAGDLYLEEYITCRKVVEQVRGTWILNGVSTLDTGNVGSL